MSNVIYLSSHKNNFAEVNPQRLKIGDVVYETCYRGSELTGTIVSLGPYDQCEVEWHHDPQAHRGGYTFQYTRVGEYVDHNTYPQTVNDEATGHVLFERDI